MRGLRVILTDFSLLLEVEIPEGLTGFKVCRTAFRRKYTLHNLVYTEILPPLLGAQQHFLGFDEIKLASPQESVRWHRVGVKRDLTGE